MRQLTPLSIDKLLSFGVKDINKNLRKDKWSLSSLDAVLQPDSGSNATLSLKWERTNPWTLETKKSTIQVVIQKYPEAFYLILRYNCNGKDKEIFYPLVKRESNLKRGTYRYYLKDIYHPERLCTKLYLNPETGDFVPRSVLRESGILYSIQRKGHRERYYFNPRRTPDTKYRKSHYRGKITPFWERLERFSEREDERYTEFLIGMGYGRGIVDRELELDVLREFRERTGREDSRRYYKSKKSKNRGSSGVFSGRSPE